MCERARERGRGSAAGGEPARRVVLGHQGRPAPRCPAAAPRLPPPRPAQSAHRHRRCARCATWYQNEPEREREKVKGRREGERKERENMGASSTNCRQIVSKFVCACSGSCVLDGRERMVMVAVVCVRV